MQARFWLLFLFAIFSAEAYGYDIRFKDHLQIDKPLRLSSHATTASIVFHTERRDMPTAGSALHLFIGHSQALDSSRSFLWITLNYGLLRSLRLDTHNESATEIVIPIGPDLLKDSNELVFSVQLFPLPGQDSSTLWAEITDRSYLRVATKQQAPSLDLRNLPFPLIEAHSYRDQVLDVLIPERASSATLEATALTIANLVNRVAPRQPLVRAVRSLNGSRNPLLIVGTRQEQPELRLLQSRLSRTDTARLITKNAQSLIPILIVTGDTPANVLSAANKLFRKSEISEREWRGFVPPEKRFTLRDLGLTELRIRPGNQGAALIPLNVTPDTRFLDYGIQAELTMDLGESEISQDAYIEGFMNEQSIGRIHVLHKLAGTQLSLRMNAPGRLLKNENVLRILWWNGDRSPAGVEGWILASSEFYLPRSYAAALPDLALLQHHLFPFSLKADLSDTFLVIPDAASPEISAGLMELAANLGRLTPSNRPSFSVRRSSEVTPAIKSNAHLIVLDTGGNTGRDTIVSGLAKPRGDPSLAKHPVMQQIVSPWNSNKYVLRIAANRAGDSQEVVRTLFTDTMLGRLQGDTVYLTPSRPVTFRFARRQTVGENFYLTHIEAWMRLHWLALPIILAFVSGLLFLAVRLALNHYKANARL